MMGIGLYLLTTSLNAFTSTVPSQLHYSCLLPGSLAPPLRHAGGGAEESGDTAIDFVAKNAIMISY